MRLSHGPYFRLMHSSQRPIRDSTAQTLGHVFPVYDLDEAIKCALARGSSVDELAL
jgi:hypothetical protein